MLKGSITALVTPFLDDGAFDEKACSQLRVLGDARTTVWFEPQNQQANLPRFPMPSIKRVVVKVWIEVGRLEKFLLLRALGSKQYTSEAIELR